MPLVVKKAKEPEKKVEKKTVKKLDEVMMGRAAQRTSSVDAENRTTRTLVGWIIDGSPSVTEFAEDELDCAKNMVRDLRLQSVTGRSVMMNVVQIANPATSTGFQEISEFQIPALQPSEGTPLHLAIDRFVEDFEETFSALRENGVDRTETVCIVTTDGQANGCTNAELKKSIERLLTLGRNRSITNLIVAIGDSPDTATLESMTNSVPVLKLADLNAELLIPFIRKIVEAASQSRRGRIMEIELMPGIEELKS